ncbi:MULTISPECIES: hexose kinase [unclassified Roseitalea]|uniref:1-phosphofructokinase family hexose kinase n=1 Tax=unclassified Roseitalea TaxID=2639107 RepID=UPI00273DAAEC|nr:MULTISPECIES: hexose kinase [unclassified Roseitalea]
MSQRTILTITLNPAVDIATEVDEVIADSKLRCGPPQFDPGGGGVNVARAVGKLGGTACALIALAGATGDMLASMLETDGVDMRRIPVDGQTRQSFTARETSTGRLYRFVTPGPPWRDEDTTTLNRMLAETLDQDAFVVISGSFPPGADHKLVPQIVETVGARGGHVVVDTSGPVLHALAGEPTGLHTLRMDREEAIATSGRALDTGADFADFGQTLIAAGVAENVVMGMGPRGSVGVSAGARFMTARPVLDPISAVGAGDSFVAAMTLAMARGADLEAALAQGTAAAASAVMTPGTALCDADQTARFLAEVTTTAL